MLQRSQNFSPFPRADNFVFQGDGPSKKIWCLDHQHLIKIYRDKITGHISYENPASKEHRRISPQTSGAPPGKPPRLPRIETIAQSGIWCLGGRSQPPHWSASILGRKWDRFKSVTTYFVTRATKKWSPLKWPAQMILVSLKKNEPSAEFWISKSSTSKGSGRSQDPKPFWIFSEAFVEVQKLPFLGGLSYLGRVLCQNPVLKKRKRKFRMLSNKSYDFPKSTAW